MTNIQKELELELSQIVDKDKGDYIRFVLGNHIDESYLEGTKNGYLEMAIKLYIAIKRSNQTKVALDIDNLLQNGSDDKIECAYFNKLIINDAKSEEDIVREKSSILAIIGCGLVIAVIIVVLGLSAYGAYKMFQEYALANM